MNVWEEDLDSPTLTETKYESSVDGSVPLNNII
jgi:hypothetical protein